MLPSAWEKRLVDLNVTGLTDEDLAWADHIFVSARIVQRESARAVIHRCRMAGVKAVAGGPLFTMESDQFPEVDHFVLNEAEETLAPFVRDLLAHHTIYVTGTTGALLEQEIGFPIHKLESGRLEEINRSGPRSWMATLTS